MPHPRADLPLCFACGAWSGGCEHVRDDRLRWTPAPWREAVLEVLGAAVFTCLFAAVLMGVGPLLWWLAYGWPPRGWIEVFGVIAVALVSIPGWVVGIGLVLSIPDHYRGRRWEVMDLRARADDRAFGFAFVRGGRPVRGSVSRVARSVLSVPGPFAMSVRTADRMTDDPRLLVPVALADLAAAGRIELALVGTSGWSFEPADPRPWRTDGRRWTVRALGPAGQDLHWLAARLFAFMQAGEVDLPLAAAELARAVISEEQTASVGGDAAPVEAALAAWRARDPATLGPLLDEITDAVARVLADGRPDDDEPEDVAG